jgi:hypothetical protein
MLGAAVLFVMLFYSIALLIDLHSLDLPICLSRVSLPAQNTLQTHVQASDSDAPFCRTNCSHVATPVLCAQLCSCPGTPDPVQTPPAQSPQRVVSKITAWFWKNWNGLQFVAGQYALGAPQFESTGAPAVISDGILLRVKNHTAIPELSQRTVNSPS